MEELLIKNTTREQREKIIREALGCDDCSDCGVEDPFEMYQPYIDGEKELSEISYGYHPKYQK